MIRIKICGIKRKEDALYAAKAGADALGFIFAVSKRKIDIETCKKILPEIPAFICTVAVFKNNEKSFIEDILSECYFSAIQFHGDEDEKFCLSFKRPVIKAFSINNESDILQVNKFKRLKTVLIDGKCPGAGEMFNHKLLSLVSKSKYIILAGGLTPDNIKETIRQNPDIYGVDTASGVEVSPGIKDNRKILDFINNARGF